MAHGVVSQDRLQCTLYKAAVIMVINVWQLYQDGCSFAQGEWLSLAKWQQTEVFITNDGRLRFLSLMAAD